MIKTIKLTKKFGSLLAVNNLSIEVAEGEIFGFLGPNGAGKTTTIRILCGLIGATLGEAWVAGYRVSSESDNVRASIGLLTESPGLYEQLSAWDNMFFFAELHNLATVLARKRVQEIMEWLDIWTRRKEPVATFSKGMKQKLAIGRALLHNPQVLFLDEPTAGLDAESARAVRDSIITLKNANRTVFLSTHNLDEAERLCDRIAIFKTELVQLDTPANLRHRFGTSSPSVKIRLRNKLDIVNVALLQALPFVQDARILPLSEISNTATVLEVALTEPEINNPELVRFLVDKGAEIQFIVEQTTSLEDVYLSLTKKTITGF